MLAAHDRRIGVKRHCAIECINGLLEIAVGSVGDAKIEAAVRAGITLLLPLTDLPLKACDQVVPRCPFNQRDLPQHLVS